MTHRRQVWTSMKKISIALALLLVGCGGTPTYEAEPRMLIKNLDGEVMETCNRVRIGDHERVLYCYDEGWSRIGYFPVEQVMVVEE